MSYQPEAVMSKYAVLIGVVFGALVGLLLGNNWTAVWVGALGAFTAAWVASLDWREYNTKVGILSKNFDVSGAGTAILNAGKTIVRGVNFFFKAISVSIHDREGRRCLISGLFVWALSGVLACTAITILSFSPYRDLLAATAFVSSFSSAVLSVIGLVVGAFILHTGLGEARKKLLLAEFYREKGEKFDDGKTPEDAAWDAFWFTWVFQFCESEHSTIRAFGEMVHIRFSNALKILGFCLVVWPGVVFLMLANTKTRMSSACAGILALIHLGGSYLWWGGIEYGNGNFWLSLVVMLALGFYLGRKISETDFATRKRTFPSPVFLNQ